VPTIRVRDFNAQILFSPGIYLRGIDQSLDLLEETYRPTIQVESFALELLLAYTPPVSGEEVAQPLLLQELIVDFLAIGDRTVIDDTLNFVEEFKVFGLEGVSDGLDLQELIGIIGPIYQTVAQPLNLVETIVGNVGVPWAPVVVSQVLFLNQFASNLSPLSISQVLLLVDSAERMTIAEDFLFLVQTIKAGKGRTISQLLGISDSHETNASLSRPLVQTLGVNQFVAYFIESPCGKKTNNRFDGEGAIPPNPKRIKYDSRLILATATQSVSLRNPETDDRGRFAFQRINRETLGGTLDIYADEGWDQSTTLLFSVVAIKAALLDTLQQFLEDTVGEEIVLHDWEGVNWRGVVTTPSESAVEDGEGYWTLAFEFVGVREPGEVPHTTLALTGTIGLQADYVRTLSQELGLSEDIYVAGPIFVTVFEQIPFQEGV